MRKRLRYIIIAITIATLAVSAIIFIVLRNKPAEVLFEPHQYRKTVKILIDAGHNAKVQGGFGPIGAEHEYTYMVSSYLAQILDRDDRFEYEISRYAIDSEEYSDNVVVYAAYNESKLLGMITTKIPGEKRGWLGHEQYVDMYAIRHYAIENNFDCLISIHFDVADKRYYENVHGFHVLVSPYNRQFERSFELANLISSNFMNDYGVSRGTRHDNTLNRDIWKQYDRLGLLARGIGFRSLVVIGDVFENAYYLNRYNNDLEFVMNIDDVPSVLLEVGYLHETKFTNEAVLLDVAQKIHSSLVDFFVW